MRCANETLLCQLDSHARGDAGQNDEKRRCTHVPFLFTWVICPKNGDVMPYIYAYIYDILKLQNLFYLLLVMFIISRQEY